MSIANSFEELFGSIKKKSIRHHMVELKLGIKRKLSRIKDAEAEIYDEEFQKLKIHVALRAQYICQGCCAVTGTGPGEASQGYFEVHHLDDDHRNNHIDNLVFLCPFCHMVFSAGKHGDDFQTGSDSAYLLWIPSIQQSTINLLAHVVFQTKCTFEHKKEWSVIPGHPSIWINENAVKAVERIERSILDYGTKKIQEIFGTSKPVECRQLYILLKDIPDEKYEERLQVLHGLRLWPKSEKFSSMIEFVSKRGVLLRKIGGILTNPIQTN